MNDQLIEETKDIVRNFTFYDIYIYIRVFEGKKKIISIERRKKVYNEVYSKRG